MNRLGLFAIVVFMVAAACGRTPEKESPFRTVADLKLNQINELTLVDGNKVTLQLLEINAVRHPVNKAVRKATAKVIVNRDTVVLESGSYNLPVIAGGVKLDCPVTRDYYKDSAQDNWALDGDARVRLWPATYKLIDTDKFGYPLAQGWMAGATQIGNEPCWVDGAEYPLVREVYYHSGLDFGGVEGVSPVLSATDGLIIQLGDSVLAGYEHYRVEPRYESICVLGPWGWIYRYSHLTGIETSLTLGGNVTKGQRLAFIGKEGNSGGWAHLHFEIYSRRPDSRWGSEDGFAYLWQAYLDRFQPWVVALSRPHQVAFTGEKVTMDGRKSIAPGSSIKSYEWLFSDSTAAPGVSQTRTYNFPGSYSEVLKVTDKLGGIDHDFHPVLVWKKSNLEPLPAIHLAAYPTLFVRPGQPVTFAVRAFNANAGYDLIDYGDGTPPDSVNSHPAFNWQNPQFQQAGLTGSDVMLDSRGYAVTTHAYRNVGRYIVRAERIGAGARAMAHVEIRVGESPK